MFIQGCWSAFRVWSRTLSEPWNTSLRLAHGLQVRHWRLGVILLQQGLSSPGGKEDCVSRRWPAHVECPSAKVCGYVVNYFIPFSLLWFVLTAEMTKPNFYLFYFNCMWLVQWKFFWYKISIFLRLKWHANEPPNSSIFVLHPHLFCVSVQLNVVRPSPTTRECFCHQTIRITTTTATSVCTAFRSRLEKASTSLQALFKSHKVTSSR